MEYHPIPPMRGLDEDVRRVLNDRLSRISEAVDGPVSRDTDQTGHRIVNTAPGRALDDVATLRNLELRLAQRKAEVVKVRGPDIRIWTWYLSATPQYSSPEPLEVGITHRTHRPNGACVVEEAHVRFDGELASDTVQFDVLVNGSSVLPVDTYIEFAPADNNTDVAYVFPGGGLRLNGGEFVRLKVVATDENAHDGMFELFWRPV